MSSSLNKKVSSESEFNKRLRIQIGICKRMLKEVASYELEVTRNEERVQKMRDDNKDSYDIKKQEEVLQESYMMIPDSKSRLEKTLMTLSDILNESADESNVDRTLLAEARAMVADNDN